MVKKVFGMLSIILFVISVSAPGASTFAQKPEPDYAKWGKLALTETKEKYPDSAISEYEFKDRKRIDDTNTMDTFEFQVKKDERAKTVKAEVLYNPQTEKLISIKLWEMK